MLKTQRNVSNEIKSSKVTEQTYLIKKPVISNFRLKYSNKGIETSKIEESETIYIMHSFICMIIYFSTLPICYTRCFQYWNIQI